MPLTPRAFPAAVAAYRSPFAISLCRARVALWSLAAIGAVVARAETSIPPIYRETFDHGVESWNAEAGQISHGGEEKSLVLRPSPGASGALAAHTVTGLKPHQTYEISVEFRFERSFEDTWPWAKLEVWAPGATAIPESDIGKLAESRIRVAARSGEVTDGAGVWRVITLRFRSGEADSVVIRLRNHPKMSDQTHWDNVTISLVNP